MYTDFTTMSPYYQSFSHEIQQLEDYCLSLKSNSLMSDLVQSSIISDYDLGGEGDLFKGPEPIIEEPVGAIDPMTAAISTISFDEDVIGSRGLEVADFESYQNEQLWSEMFNDCKNDIVEKAVQESPLSEILDVNIPVVVTDERRTQESKLLPDVPFHKSVSSGCLGSMEWMHGTALKPSFLELPAAVDFGEVYGMRRSFSEGDIKVLGNGSVNTINVSIELPLTISNCHADERREKLLRYRNKKSKRNFGRKIKYACRKALADNQPRIRGRFAKTKESEASKRLADTAGWNVTDIAQ